MDECDVPRIETTPSGRRAILKWIVQSAAGVVAYGVLIFLAAGRLDWVWGWALLALLAAFLIAHPLILVFAWRLLREII